jgi:hypothetical protein
MFGKKLSKKDIKKGLSVLSKRENELKREVRPYYSGHQTIKGPKAVALRFYHLGKLNELNEIMQTKEYLKGKLKEVA